MLLQTYLENLGEYLVPEIEKNVQGKKNQDLPNEKSTDCRFFLYYQLHFTLK